jgi:hypothetical protein
MPTLLRVTPEPEMLVGPHILYRDDRHTVWHAGVVEGPSGSITLSIQIDSREQGRFRDPEWRTEKPPIDAYIEVPGLTGPVVGSFSYGPDRSAFHFQQWFHPVDRQRLPGAELHIKIHPLALHLVVDLTPP